MDKFPRPQSPIRRCGSPFTNPELVCIDPGRVHEIWPHASALVRLACRRTALNAFEDIESDVLSGRSLLWLAWNGLSILAAATTVLTSSEIGRVCVITACGGGKMELWFPLIDGIEAYARAEGCERVRIYGRKGWIRVLHGYRARHVILDKDLTSSVQA